MFIISHLWRKVMQRRLRNFTVGVLTSAMLASTASAGTLMVYSSTDADNLKYYMDEFQKDNPDIKVNVVRESTGYTCCKDDGGKR